MSDVIATVTSKGQVTIPKRIRDLLGVGLHGRVVFTATPDGTVTVRALKYPTLDSLVGAAGKLRRPAGDDLVVVAREERAARRRK